jgi:hypothetical protein
MSQIQKEKLPKRASKKSSTKKTENRITYEDNSSSGIPRTPTLTDTMLNTVNEPENVVFPPSNGETSLSYDDGSSLTNPLPPTLLDRSGVIEELVADTTEQLSSSSLDTIGKKRGRKPRGGKLIIRPTETQEQMRSVSNVILHLKCSMKDLYEHNAQLNRIVTDPLKYNPDVPPEVVTYNDSTAGFTTFNYGATENILSSSAKPKPICETNAVFQTNGTHSQCATCRAANIPSDLVGDLSCQFDSNSTSDNMNIKDINAKLKILKVQLYKNAIQLDKKSACFWCTYDFDNIPCHIPKYELDDTIYGYGSFCRPECAVAYLMKENIDDSTKFERYQLLNQIYSKIYGCKKNIKPAPNPYYLLDKYYGNLTIQEYRKLLKTEHLLLVIDKPLTRILPELHEDNEDMIMNVYGINKSTESISGVYKVKRQSEKQQGPSKASIIRSKFGLS